MIFDKRMTQEMLALLGSGVTQLLRDGIPFELHELSQALQRLKENEINPEIKQRYEAIIRLLSELMH